MKAAAEVRSRAVRGNPYQAVVRTADQRYRQNERAHICESIRVVPRKLPSLLQGGYFFNKVNNKQFVFFNQDQAKIFAAKS